MMTIAVASADAEAHAEVLYGLAYLSLNVGHTLEAKERAEAMLAHVRAHKLKRAQIAAMQLLAEESPPRCPYPVL
jgi:hypothetical protein